MDPDRPQVPSRADFFASAQRCFPTFDKAIATVPSLPRGVTVAEIFFVYAASAHLEPRQIVESGRALGQSTQLLAMAFPETRIVSIDIHPDHPDVQPALERLVPYPNVSCLFGNSMVVMPSLTLPGDVCIIDGPKEFRAVELAYTLLQNNRPGAVFIHDSHAKSQMRPYFERHVPELFYSDDPEFMDLYGHLNDRFEKPSAVDLDPCAGVFACLYPRPGFPNRVQQTARVFYRISANMRHSVRKRSANRKAA